MADLPIRPSTPPADPSFGPEHTPYDALGGETQVRLLVDTFYHRMDTAPAYQGIRSLHAADLAKARDKLFMFLSGWLGGPQLYVERYGHPRLRARHMPFAIGPRERDQWLACMTEALDALEVDGPLREFLDARFEHVATFMMNRNG